MDVNLSIDTGLVRKILTGFIRSEINRVGYSHGVVNLSGGLDSAVSYHPGGRSPRAKERAGAAPALQNIIIRFTRARPTIDRPVRL